MSAYMVITGIPLHTTCMAALVLLTWSLSSSSDTREKFQTVLMKSLHTSMFTRFCNKEVMQRLSCQDWIALIVLHGTAILCEQEKSQDCFFSANCISVRLAPFYNKSKMTLAFFCFKICKTYSFMETLHSVIQVHNTVPLPISISLDHSASPSFLCTWSVIHHNVMYGIQ